MQKPNLSNMRVRTPVMTQTVTEQTADVWQNHGAVHSHSKLGTRVTARKTRRMYDVVTPNFKKLSAQGEIFNNPMYSIEEELKFPLTNFIMEKKEGMHANANSMVQYPVPQARLFYDDTKYRGAYNSAIVDAYAKISANEGNTLLWIGELKESISMFLDIGKGARALYEKTAAQRKRWASGKLNVKEAQSLTLQLLYGIMPLEQQITDFLAGLFETKQANSRSTARAFRVKTDDATYTRRRLTGTVNGYAGVIYDEYNAESTEVVIRAGVLFEVDISDTPWLSIILEPKAVISTAYALARLSFVIDWIINVGGTLAAWSPSAGVKELSAWTSVEFTHTHIAEMKPSHEGDSPNKGNGRYERTVKEKWRVPISRTDLVVIPPLDVNLDIEKVLAMVLLFAKIKDTGR